MSHAHAGVSQEGIGFDSDGLRLAGVVHRPANLPVGERRPAFVILHGFGGHKDGPQQHWPANQLAEWGYVTMRFDFRGCGDSEGRHGWVIPLEQVADVANAVTYMAGRADVDPDRIGLIGTSYGAAVACYAGGVDKRVAAVIAQGGWADGSHKAQEQHPTPQAWKRFTDMLDRGRRLHREKGETLMVHRYDIVPVPERLRGNIEDGKSIMEFPVDTALTTMDFRPADKVGEIAPRPLLLLHSVRDGVTPARATLELFEKAGHPTDLHLLTDVDHFMFGENNPRVIHIVQDWVQRYLPVG